MTEWDGSPHACQFVLYPMTEISPENCHLPGAHCGATVKHRSRVRQDPTQPNLRQVHLIHEGVPPEDFTLREQDEVAIKISGIGELRNPVTVV